MPSTAYLHSKATAWYKRFPPIHSPDRAEDPKTPQVDGGDGAGGSPEDEEDVAELSDIAWYIAGAGCYIPPFISGVLYS